MSVQSRWDTNIRAMFGGSSFTHHIYKEGVIVSTGKRASDYPQHTAPEGIPLWTFPYSDKVVYWVVGIPPGGSTKTAYQVIVHNNGTLTRKLPSSATIPEMTEYTSDNTTTTSKEICYSSSLSEVSSLYPNLTMPVTDDSSVYRWTVYFENDTATSIVAYLET